MEPYAFRHLLLWSNENTRFSPYAVQKSSCCCYYNPASFFQARFDIELVAQRQEMVIATLARHFYFVMVAIIII